MDALVEDKYKADLQTLEFSNIFVTKIGHMADQPDQFFTNYFERHDHCLQYVVRGKGEYFINGRLYPLSAQSLFLLPKKRYHYYRADREDPYEYYWIHFSGDGMEGFLEMIGMSEDSPVLYSVGNPEIVAVFEEMIALSSSRQRNERLLLLSACYRLLYAIAACVPRQEMPPQPYRSKIVTQAVNCIAENFAQPLGLDALAEAVHLNKCYFVSLFKSQTGITPMQYLLRYRIAVACKLLLTDRPIGEIAALCGFFEPTNFFVRFKKATGLTPGGYRARLRAGETHGLPFAGDLPLGTA